MQITNVETNQTTAQPSIPQKATRLTCENPVTRATRATCATGARLRRRRRKKQKALRTTLFDLVAAVDREVPDQKDDLVARIVGHLLASRQIRTQNARKIVVKS